MDYGTPMKERKRPNMVILFLPVEARQENEKSHREYGSSNKSPGTKR